MTPDAPGQDGAEQSRTRIFLSYSRRDMAFTDRLEAALTARGFEVLIDRAEIYAFEDWWSRIENLIARADTVVFVLSPDAVASEVAQKEVAFAASLNKRFAPVVCRRVDDKAVPDALAKLNFVFFDDAARFDESADRLAEALSTDIGWIRMHTEVGEAARRWASAKRPSGLLLRSPVLEETERWIAARPVNAPAPTGDTQAFIAQSRQGATRRRNVLTGSLVAGLVLALALAGLAYWQRGIAEEQRQIAVAQRGLAEKNEAQAKTERDRATRNFEVARGAADRLVLDIASGLRNARGMRQDVVAKMLAIAQSTFDQLAASVSDDLVLQRSRWAMLNEFGTTYERLGYTAEALTAYRDMQAIAERLAAADPDNPENPENQVLRGRSRYSIGTVLALRGDYDDALTNLDDGLAVFRTLADAHPDDPAWQRYYQQFVADGHTRIGQTQRARSRPDDAAKSARDALAILERLAAADPGNATWKTRVAASYHDLGVALENQAAQKKEPPDEALTAYRRSLQIWDQLAAAAPDDAALQRSVSLECTATAFALTQLGHHAEAVDVYRRGVAILERLVGADPSSMDLLSTLAFTYERLSYALVALGRREEALQTLQDSKARHLRLVALDPGNKSYIDNLGSVGWAFILARDFATAIEVSDKAIAAAPEKIWFQSNRAHSLMFLGRIDEAKAVYLKYRGTPNVESGRPWEDVIRADFAELREAGLANPLMDEIEAAFASAG